MTLGIDGAWDVLRKLEWDIAIYRQVAGEMVPSHAEAYREIRFPMYAAINAAATAWSLVEWVWFEVELEPASRSRLLLLADAGETADLKGLKPALRRKVPAINACNQIAHAAKHAQVSDVTPGFATDLSIGIWEKAGWHHFSVDAKLRFGESGKEESIEEILDFVRQWWLNVLTDLDIPDRARLVPDTSSAR